MIDIKELSRAFRQRETELRPPALDYKWNELERGLSATVGSDFKNLYRLFDGFINYDRPSQLRLWSVAEIGTNKQATEYISNHQGWVAVGDFLLDSDLIVAEIGKKDAVVKRAYDDVFMSSNLEELCAR